MDSFQAERRVIGKIDSAGVWKEPNLETKVTPCVVVDGYFQPGANPGESGEYRLVALSRIDGEVLDDVAHHFVATAPELFAADEPAKPTHEHDYASKGQPVVEGSRIVGMRFLCQIAGCDESRFVPSGGIPGR